MIFLIPKESNMNILGLIIGGIFALFLMMALSAYKIGTQKTFKRLLSISVPLVLAGTGVRIGHIVLPNDILISYYIAGIGSILFYFILKPLFIKNESDRYRRISKQSRVFALFLALIEVWLIVAFILFFFHILYTQELSGIKFLKEIFIFPIKFLWFFPNMM